MQKEDDVLLNELVQSNRLLAEANRKMLKRLNANNAQIEELHDEIARIRANSIASKHLKVIKEQIDQKSETLIKLNQEVEQLRKENLSKEEQNAIIRSLKKKLQELSRKNKDMDRIKVMIKEKDEIIADFMKEVKKHKENEGLLNQAALEMQENLQRKDGLIVKLNREVEENKRKVIETKNRMKDLAELAKSSREHVRIITKDNEELVKTNEGMDHIKGHLRKNRMEHATMKKRIHEQEVTIQEMHKKHRILSDNLPLLMRMKVHLEKAEAHQQKSMQDHKGAINDLIKRLKEK